MSSQNLPHSEVWEGMQLAWWGCATIRPQPYFPKPTDDSTGNHFCEWCAGSAAEDYRMEADLNEVPSAFGSGHGFFAACYPSLVDLLLRHADFGYRTPFSTC